MSSLDGSLNIFDLSTKRSIDSIPHQEGSSVWAENIAWIGKDCMVRNLSFPYRLLQMMKNQ